MRPRLQLQKKRNPQQRHQLKQVPTITGSTERMLVNRRTGIQDNKASTIIHSTAKVNSISTKTGNIPRAVMEVTTNGEVMVGVMVINFVLKNLM